MNMFKRPGQPRLLRKQSTPQPAAGASEPVLKSPREIQIMREAGRIVARVHAALREAVRPGVSTWDLDQLAVDTMAQVQRYLVLPGLSVAIRPTSAPASTKNWCTAFPSKDRILKDGDIISIDIGVRYRGFIGDSAWTYAVGEISAEAHELMQVTEESLYAGIAKATVGNRVVDISRAVQTACGERTGMHVVREYTGHGVGRQMHEAPQVLNYASDDPTASTMLQPGLVIAIEPMVQVGTWQTRTLKDNWTVVSKDGSLAAHFEHTVAITNNGPEILTLP